MQPVFDGHNDILLRLWLAGDSDGSGFIHGTEDTHIDAIKARTGGLKGGFFAMFTPSRNAAGNILGTDPVAGDDAIAATDAMVAILASISRRRPDILRQCHDAAETRAAMDAGAIAAILHIEGAEAIREDLSNLEAYYGAGLRSIGPVWSRDNVFGCGVPFTFPGSPDQGEGLTGAGADLIRACNALGIMIDLSHLNAAGFRDIARITSRPLIATHSNVHALSPSPRNLTDWQLDAIAESGGLVGVNFAAGFLRDDGRKNPQTSLETILRHLDALVARLGENGVALGSDFDGAVIPAEIGDCSGLPKLIAAMRDAGYGDALIHRICEENWLRQIQLQIG